MRNLLCLKLSLIGILVLTLLVSCSNHDNVMVPETENHTDVTNHLYEQTINDFKDAVVADDPQALYDLVDLNYEGDVYWTVNEAQDLINFYNDEPYLLDQQILYLKESIPRLEMLEKVGVNDHHDKEKRIPFAPLEDGLVFLQPNGKLSIKVFKHTVFVNEPALGDFDELILNYEHTDKQFKFNSSDINDHKYKNLNNEEVVDLMHVGPGNYIIKSQRIYNDQLEEYEEMVELTSHDMSLNMKYKNEKIIHLFF